MSRKRHKKTSTTSNPKADWPSWFIEPTHPAEQEMLFWVLQNNSHLREIHFIVNAMQVNYLIFKMNYAELVRLHKGFDHPFNFSELALQTEKGRQITQDYILEFTRLLHNFLASAKMLVDVTRRWVRQQFEGSDFMDKYQQQVLDRFTNNVQARFLEDLRNFTLHRALPLSVPELRFHEVDEHTLKSSLGIVLLKTYLLDGENWSKLGRNQIDLAIDGEVDIITICEQYFDNVTAFNQWLFWQVRGLYNFEIEQINSVINNMRNHEE